MLMPVNRVARAFHEGRPSFGTYVMTPAPRMIELLAASGLDFVRIDMEGGFLGIETVQSMIHASHAVGITPFVRTRGPDVWQIRAALKMGALGIVIPGVAGVEDVVQAVRAAKGPPRGERPMSTGSVTGGYGKASLDEYVAWAEENIVLSAQIETKSGVHAVDEIVQIPGLDMVQSGRGDLSYSYGVDGEQDHPMVLEAELRVIEAGRRAGKMTSVQYYPLRHDAHVDRVRDWIARGVSCLSLGSDKDIVEPYRRILERLKA